MHVLTWAMKIQRIYFKQFERWYHKEIEAKPLHD
jgi:hypothetical protein